MMLLFWVGIGHAQDNACGKLPCPGCSPLNPGALAGGGTIDVRQYGAKGDGHTDDTQAILDAVAAARMSQNRVAAVRIPAGEYLLAGSATIALKDIELVCEGGPADATVNPADYGRQGATFWLTGTRVQPFTIAGGVRIVGCNFYWPEQNGASARPIAYPPLFTEAPGTQMGNLDLIEDRVINAYDVIAQARTSDSFGNIHLTDTYGYAIRYWLSLANVQETVTISGMAADWNLFQNVVNTGHKYLARWTAQHGAFLHVFGNGNGTTASTVSVGGLDIDIDVFAYNKLIWVDGTGALGETTVRGIADAVPHILEVDPGGCATQMSLDALYWSYQWLDGGRDHAPAFSVIAPAHRGCTVTLDLRGVLNRAQGDVLDLEGNSIKTVRISLQGGGTYANSTTPGTYYFAKINGANVIFDAIGNHIEPATIGPRYRGILLRNSYTANIVGNSANGVYNLVDPAANPHPINVASNVAIATTSTSTIAGSGDTNINALGNQFDKVNPAVDGTLRLGNVIVSTGPVTLGACTGVGGGSCSLHAGANGWIGYVTLSPQGSPASTGVVTLDLPVTSGNSTLCNFTPVNGSASWTPPVSVVAKSVSGNRVQAIWTNARRPLTAGRTYAIAYECHSF